MRKKATMKRMALLGAAMCALAGAAQAVDRVDVAVGKAEIVRVDTPFTQLILPATETADVQVLTDRSFYIYGKKAGATNVLLLNAKKQPVATIDVDVGFDARGIAAQIARMLPNETIEVTNTPNGVILRGTVSDAVAAQEAAAIAERYAPGAVTNSMAVRAPQQVILEVRFVEASRRLGRELGVDTDYFDGSTESLTGRGRIGFAKDAINGNDPAFGTLVVRNISSGKIIQVELDALERSGVIRTLAKPNLAALSGDTASFLAGGEFPIPVAEENDRITIAFKQFGVGLSFTPTVLRNGRMNLKVESEVSQIDPTFSIRTDRIQIPGLQVRRAGTTLDLSNGQSFAMAGLLQSNYTNVKNQLPWVGDIPVLGTLFRSTSFERGETELVVIVTPRLVDPNARPELRDPLSDTTPPTDAELFLGGVLENPTKAAPPTPSASNNAGGAPETATKATKAPKPQGQRPRKKRHNHVS
jgi:pilus assembly protein CpaC